jgi:hypothetical protein
MKKVFIAFPDSVATTGLPIIPDTGKEFSYLAQFDIVQVKRKCCMKPIGM